MSTACPPGPLTRRHLIGWGLAAFGGAAALPDLLRGIPPAGAAAAAASNDTGFVAVIGDSLTVGTQPYQADDLRGAGWESATLNAYVSRGIATKMDSDPNTGLTAVDAVRWSGAEPDLWIVALGTNDAGLVGMSGYPALIARMLDHIGDRPVLWVNIYLPRNSGRQAAWNAALDDAAAARRQLRVFDWASIAGAHPAWLTTDGVHYTGAGYQQRAAALADASLVTVAALSVQEPSRRVDAAATPLVAAGSPSRLVPLQSPVRVLDTRRAGGRLAAEETRVVDLGELIPAGATSVVVNLTAVDATGDGYLTAWDAAGDRPATSTLNVAAGRAVATHTTCTCASGRLRIAASTSTHVIVDVQAAFGPDGTLGLRSGNPSRLHDSRDDSGAVQPGTVLTLTVPPTGGRRPGAALVGVTLTDIAAGGYVTLWPADQDRPATSNLNVAPSDGAVVNTAHVALDAGGRFHIATTAHAAVVIDLLAVYDDGDDGLWYQAAQPTRVLDTRSGIGGWQGAPAADQTIDVRIDAPGSVALAGIVALPATRPGYLVAWAGEGSAPPSSTLNLSTSDVRSVCAPVTASTQGIVVIDTVGGGGADVVMDVCGWYAPND